MESNSIRNPFDELTADQRRSTAQGDGSNSLGNAQPGGDGVGRQFGRFALLNVLGRGGMGEVYRAVHVNLKKTVALKVLPGELLSNEKAIARFRRETCWTS